jgi:hypothetical protein
MRKLCLIIICLFISISGISQNEKLKVVFIYNFTKYISWPPADSQGDFIIGVLGSTSMSDELKSYAGDRKVGARSIKVMDFASAGSVQNCHIIYVAAGKSGDLSSVISKFKAQAVIVVADSPGAIQKGAAINFVIADGKQNFELSKTNIENNGIKVNSQLLDLGIQK